MDSPGSKLTQTVCRHRSIVLPLHLKRFKYIEQFQRHQKLLRPVFVPLELKLSDLLPLDCEDGDRVYSLLSIVIHIGASASNGHYVTIVRRAGRWILFDDDEVTLLNFAIMERIFGVFVNRPREYTTAEEDFEINPPPEILGRWRRKRRSTTHHHDRRRGSHRGTRHSRPEQDAQQSSTGASSGEDDGAGGVGGALFTSFRADGGGDSATESAMEGDVDTEASEVDSEGESGGAARGGGGGGGGGGDGGGLGHGRRRRAGQNKRGEDDDATGRDGGQEGDRGKDSSGPVPPPPHEYEPDDLRSPVGYVLFYGDKEMCSV